MPVNALSNAKAAELLQLMREYAMVPPSPHACPLRLLWGAARTPRGSPCPRPICRGLRPGHRRGRGGLTRPPLVPMGQPPPLPLVPVGKPPPLLTRLLAGMGRAKMARGIRQHAFELQPVCVQAALLLRAVEPGHASLQPGSQRALKSGSHASKLDERSEIVLLYLKNHPSCSVLSVQVWRQAFAQAAARCSGGRCRAEWECPAFTGKPRRFWQLELSPPASVFRRPTATCARGTLNPCGAACARPWDPSVSRWRLPDCAHVSSPSSS